MLFLTLYFGFLFLGIVTCATTPFDFPHTDPEDKTGDLDSLTVGISAIVIGALGIAALILHHSPFGVFILYICYIQFKRWSSKGVRSHGIFDFECIKKTQC